MNHDDWFERWYDSKAVEWEWFSEPAARTPVAPTSLESLITKLDPAPWKAGDPCGSCGSTETGIDFFDVGYCDGCGRSDSDE